MELRGKIMKPENEVVIKDIVGSIRRLVRAVYLDSQKISKQFGLTGPQSGVLRNLVHYGPTSSADLSRKLYVTPSNITGIIDRLGKKGLVERIKKEGDRRVALLSKLVPDPIEKKFIAELADLEPEHVKILAMAMQQILNLIDTQGIEEIPLELSPESGPVIIE
jgi:DNA-binding MarR family transcriptional regulator